MLQAGTSRTVITPGPGAALVGYAGRPGRGNDGVLAPLTATALALRFAGDEPVVVFALDLCLLESDVADWLRGELGAALPLPADRVILSCSHTHSGPLARPRALSGERDAIAQLGGAGLEEDAYARLLLERLRAAARAALDGLRPCRLAWRQGALELGYNRRSPDGAGGVRHCWNVHQFPDRAPQPLPDATVSLLELAFESGAPERLLWFGAGLHPVVLGKESNRVSPDWPGSARALLEKELPGSTAFFTLDAAGEAHPWLATQSDPAAVERVGAAVGGPLALWAESLPQGKAVEAFAWREERLEIGDARLALGVLRIGPVGVLFLPLECFGSLGRELRRRFEGPLLLATLANGWEAYWPDRAAFGEGGYEVDIARRYGRRPGDGERLVEQALELLRREFPI
jgi:hypothetical protein